MDQSNEKMRKELKENWAKEQKKMVRHSTHVSQRQCPLLASCRLTLTLAQSRVCLQAHRQTHVHSLCSVYMYVCTYIRTYIHACMNVRSRIFTSHPLDQHYITLCRDIKEVHIFLMPHVYWPIAIHTHTC